jgi:hypothetical protein
MEPWEILISSYGLVLSPMIGIRMLIKRFNGSFKSYSGMFFYLLVGIVNIGLTIFTLIILPGDSWLRFLAILILLFYLGVFGAPQIQRDLK